MPGSYVADFRYLIEIRVSGAGVREVARDNPFRRDARRAFVVASDEAFGLAPTTPWPDQPPDKIFGAN